MRRHSLPRFRPTPRAVFSGSSRSRAADALAGHCAHTFRPRDRRPRSFHLAVLELHSNRARSTRSNIPPTLKGPVARTGPYFVVRVRDAVGRFQRSAARSWRTRRGLAGGGGMGTRRARLAQRCRTSIASPSRQFLVSVARRSERSLCLTFANRSLVAPAGEGPATPLHYL